MHNDSVEGALKTGGSSAGGRGIGAASANMSTPIGQDSNRFTSRGGMTHTTEEQQKAHDTELSLTKGRNQTEETENLPGINNDDGD